jgi:hypothetical protein
MMLNVMKRSQQPVACEKTPSLIIRKQTVARNLKQETSAALMLSERCVKVTPTHVQQHYLPGEEGLIPLPPNRKLQHIIVANCGTFRWSRPLTRGLSIDLSQLFSLTEYFGRKCVSIQQ